MTSHVLAGFSSEAEPPGKEHILLVDDSELMLKLYSRFLEAEGYRVTTANGGRAALATLERETPDLILLDFMMPQINGEEVLKQIRRNPRLAEIPTVFLTASTLDVARAFELGATDFFTKPIDQRILIARARAIIKSDKLRKVAQESKLLSLENERIREEIRQAQAVQKAQLPRMPVRWEGWAATGALLPCDDVGGDLFDIIEGSGARRTIVLVDVSGHGLAAAMVASNIQGMLRVLIKSCSLEHTMAELNNLLCASMSDHYACIALIQIEGDDAYVINAGLPPLVAVAGGEIVARVWASGTPPGLLPGARYEACSLELRRRTQIVLSSDGLTEPFGHIGQTETYLERLGLLGDGYSPRCAESADLSERIRRLFLDACLRQEDDATVVVIEREPEYPLSR